MSIEELVTTHANVEFMEQRPELVMFAGDAGGEGFFFDPTTAGPGVLMIALISNWIKDATPCASSMEEFFERVHAGYKFLG